MKKKSYAIEMRMKKHKGTSGDVKRSVTTPDGVTAQVHTNNRKSYNVKQINRMLFSIVSNF